MKLSKLCILLFYCPIIFLCLTSTAVLAQAKEDLSNNVSNKDYVSYSASFFERFRPVTALDMVNQVPGFQLEEETEDIRGFSETAGNILINDRRPSAKQDVLSSILSRISADSVARIELIRGQVRSIDMRGEPQVVNIILRDDTSATIQWETELERRFNFGHVAPSGNLSLTDIWRKVEFNVGLEGKHEPAGRTGVDRIFNATGDLTENRFDRREIRNYHVKGNLNAASNWGNTLVQFNTSLRYDFDDVSINSRRVPIGPGNQPRDDVVEEDEDVLTFEAGVDAERELHSDITGKIILLYNQRKLDLLSIQRNINNIGDLTLLRQADSRIDSTETIARLEFDWDGHASHLVQFNMERAFNSLDSNLNQTDDAGSGPVEVDVPGANSRIEEERWDFELKDTWRKGKLEVDYGLGAEISTLSQSGDAIANRDFVFLKPQVVTTFTMDNGYLSRLQFSREVSQLNLNGFVSATVFDENDLALGNPNIKPDRTWILELVQEKRFGSQGVVKITAFHHWISDVLDLIPITRDFEAPGNIGNGKRWGVVFDSTIPLDFFKLANAKLNFRIRWQDSVVVDPVTGNNRVLSLQGGSGGGIRFRNENRYAWFVEYRQDFQNAGVSWGWNMIERAERFLFKVNELEVFNEGMDINVFIETSRWFGVKMRITGENLLNFQEQRDRSIYLEERELSPLDSIQLRRRTRGAQLFFTVSGSF